MPVRPAPVPWRHRSAFRASPSSEDSLHPYRILGGRSAWTCPHGWLRRATHSSRTGRTRALRRIDESRCGKAVVADAVRFSTGVVFSHLSGWHWGTGRCGDLTFAPRSSRYPDQSLPAPMSSAVFDPSWSPYGATPSRRSTFSSWVRNASLGRGRVISRDAGLAMREHTFG